MKLVELGTFGLLVLFVAGMTLQNQGRLQAKEDQADARQETTELEDRLAELEAKTSIYTVTHDHKSATNTVYATLDADNSFDAGSAAQYHFVTVPVYNEDKPICIKWEEGCSERSNNDLFEEKRCECEEYLEDDCGDQIYLPECSKYREDCIDEEDCDCVKYATKTIDYVDACEYLKLDHEGRRGYVRRHVANAAYDDLTYSWEQVNGPEIDRELFDQYKEKKSLKLELLQGDYRFRCTITDPYNYESSITKDVKVISEPNNAPEAYISGGYLVGSELDEFLATKEKLKEPEKKSK
jgi:hypothetical protein